MIEIFSILAYLIAGMGTMRLVEDAYSPSFFELLAVIAVWPIFLLIIGLQETFWEVRDLL